MDQGISTAQAAPSAPSYALRLVLVFFGAVFGLLVLGFVFGSSSASADEGDDGLLSGVTGAVSTTVERVAAPVKSPVQAAPAKVSKAVQTVAKSAPAATTTAPVVETVDAVLEPVVGDALGSSPVGSLLDPVVTVIDDGLAGTVDAIGPVAGLLAPAPVISSAAPEAATALADAAETLLISGAASGVLVLTDLAPAGDSGAVGATALGTGLVAAFLGAGLFVLLASRRLLLAGRGMPGSPVYATDSSPD